MSQQNDVVTVGQPERPDTGTIECTTYAHGGVSISVAPQRTKMTMSLLASSMRWGITIDNAGWLLFGNMGQGITYKVVGVHEEYGNTILDLDRMDHA